MSTGKLRVCSLESRRQNEMALLISKMGGEPTIAPSLREIPLDENPQAFEFARRLLARELDVVIFLTGVGTRALREVLETRYPAEEFLAALAHCTVVVRGPKPTAVLREWKVRIDHRAPEPNTWRELLACLDAECPVSGKRLAIQEYGQPNRELYTELAARGADVFAVPIYRWALPEDVQPLQQAVRGIIAGQFDVLMLTSAQQIHHLLLVAAELGLEAELRAAANQLLIASIGPTASETLEQLGFPVDIEPEHTKMGTLVKVTLENGAELLEEKRAAK